MQIAEKVVVFRLHFESKSTSSFVCACAMAAGLSHCAVSFCCVREKNRWRERCAFETEIGVPAPPGIKKTQKSPRIEFFFSRKLGEGPLKRLEFSSRANQMRATEPD